MVVVRSAYICSGLEKRLVGIIHAVRLTIVYARLGRRKYEWGAHPSLPTLCMPNLAAHYCSAQFLSSRHLPSLTRNETQAVLGQTVDEIETLDEVVSDLNLKVGVVKYAQHTHGCSSSPSYGKPTKVMFAETCNGVFHHEPLRQNLKQSTPLSPRCPPPPERP